jgi:hypothetical protein
MKAEERADGVVANNEWYWGGEIYSDTLRGLIVAAIHEAEDAARAEEREACAKLLVSFAEVVRTTKASDQMWVDVLGEEPPTIRARGE